MILSEYMKTNLIALKLKRTSSNIDEIRKDAVDECTSSNLPLFGVHMPPRTHLDHANSPRIHNRMLREQRVQFVRTTRRYRARPLSVRAALTRRHSIHSHIYCAYSKTHVRSRLVRAERGSTMLCHSSQVVSVVRIDTGRSEYE